MEKPRLFISAVTRELATARQRIAHILLRKGYEPVWQDIFGTEPGDLRDMLREKIDTCAGLIQITGDAYGAEPADPHPTFGRCSYTQFEFLYALQQKKKTWLLLAGPEVTRDHPRTELDLPRAPHPDPAAWQQERRELQQHYKQRPEFQQHLRHTAESDLALDSLVKDLDDELAALRAEWQQWQQTVTTTLTHTTRWHQLAIRLILIALVLLYCIIGILHARRISQEKEAEERRKQAAEQKATLAAQSVSLAEVIKSIDEIKLVLAATGQSFRDLTKEHLERLLAVKADITVDQLRSRITAGEASPDPIERARALLLKGEFDAALKETTELENTRTTDLIAVLEVKAQAYGEKFQFENALATRQKIAALTDKKKDPAAWASAQNMVAYSLASLNRLNEAELVLHSVVTERKSALGPDHADTLLSRDKLANVLRKQEEHEKEAKEIQAVLGLRKNKLGAEDPNTLKSRNSYGAALRALKKYPEAVEQYKSVLEVRVRLLGPKAPDTLLSHYNLSLALSDQGDDLAEKGEKEAARKLWRVALANAEVAANAGELASGKGHKYLDGFADQVAQLKAKLKE